MKYNLLALEYLIIWIFITALFVWQLMMPVPQALLAIGIVLLVYFIVTKIKQMTGKK